MANRFGMEYGAGSSTSPGMNQGGFGSPDIASPGGTSQGPRKGYDEQNLLPVTIRMIKNSDQSNVLPDGREPHQIKLVAAVREMQRQSTNIVYVVEDGTGLIEVKEWVDDMDNFAVVEMRDKVEKSKGYIRVVGKIDDYQGKKQVVGYSVRSLSSGNELTHHALEVVHSSEKFKRGDQIVGAPQQQQTGFGTNTGVGVGFGSNTISSPTQQINGGSAMNNTASASGGDGGLKSEVFDYLRENASSSEYGADIRPFVQQSNHSEAQIREVLVDMSSEGNIYSSVDDNHYNVV